MPSPASLTPIQSDDPVLNRVQRQWVPVLNRLLTKTLPEVVAAPASATARGSAGQIAYDGSYLYVCTAPNTWKRAALSTW